MSIYSYEHNRRRERHQQVERTKRHLAQSVMMRINEELMEDPDATEFSTPVLKPEKTVMRILRDHPEIIARRLDLGRLVSLELDESTEPPELTIRLGQRFEHEHDHDSQE